MTKLVWFFAVLLFFLPNLNAFESMNPVDAVKMVHDTPGSLVVEAAMAYDSGQYERAAAYSQAGIEYETSEWISAAAQTLRKSLSKLSDSTTLKEDTKAAIFRTKDKGLLAVLGTYFLKTGLHSQAFDIRDTLLSDFKISQSQPFFEGELAQELQVFLSFAEILDPATRSWPQLETLVWGRSSGSWLGEISSMLELIQRIPVLISSEFIPALPDFLTNKEIPILKKADLDLLLGILRFRTLQFEQKPVLAFSEWRKLQPELLARGRAFFPSLEEDFILGFLRDLFDAGRLSGNLSETSQAFQTIASLFSAEAAVYSLELAARLERARNKTTEEQKLLRKSYEIAEFLYTKEQINVQDLQRIQWTLLRSFFGSESSEKPETWALLGKIQYPDYFSDILETQIILEATRNNWLYIKKLITEYPTSLSSRVLSKARLLFARQVLLNKRSSIAEKDFAKKLLDLVHTESSSVYYAVHAAIFSKSEISLNQIFTRNDSALGQVLPDFRSDEESVVIKLYLKALELGYSKWSASGLIKLRKKLDYLELEKAGKFALAADDLPMSINFFDYRRSYFGHSSDRSVLGMTYPRPYRSDVDLASDKNKLPNFLLYALLRTESHFNPSVDSQAGAQGIAQFMPETARATAKSMRLEPYDVKNPVHGIAMSGYHLAELKERQPNWAKVLGAYNAGAARIKSLSAKLPSDQFIFNELFPITETRDYIRRIVESMMVYEYLYQEKPDYKELLAGILGGVSTE